MPGALEKRSKQGAASWSPRCTNSAIPSITEFAASKQQRLRPGIVHIPHLDLSPVEQIAPLLHRKSVEQAGADTDTAVALARALPMDEAGAHRAVLQRDHPVAPD